MRGKPTEDDRMDRTDARASQHCEGRFGHHRHVDQDAVALDDADARQHAGQTRDLVAQLAIGDMPDLASNRAVPDQRDALAPPRHDMAVDRIPAGVEPGARKPAVKGRPAPIEHAVPAPLPVDCLGRLRPEFLRPFERAAIGLQIARHRLPPSERHSLVPLRSFTARREAAFCGEAWPRAGYNPKLSDESLLAVSAANLQPSSLFSCVCTPSGASVHTPASGGLS